MYANRTGEHAHRTQRRTATQYRTAVVDGLKMFYREAGPEVAPTIVVLHGFPSSSHMFRELIPRLADRFHVIVPDYPGFGYSDAPDAATFQYSFDRLASLAGKLLLEMLGLRNFSVYLQDYGAPVGFRLAAEHPEAIQGIVVQNGNAYAEGIGPGFDAVKPLWENRNAETEEPVRALLEQEMTRFQYTHGVRNPHAISPDSYMFDQMFLDRPGNAEVHYFDTGHFALEEDGAEIAEKVGAFLRRFAAQQEESGADKRQSRHAVLIKNG